MRQNDEDPDSARDSGVTVLAAFGIEVGVVELVLSEDFT